MRWAPDPSRVQLSFWLHLGSGSSIPGKIPSGGRRVDSSELHSWARAGRSSVQGSLFSGRQTRKGRKGWGRGGRPPHCCSRAVCPRPDFLSTGGPRWGSLRLDTRSEMQKRGCLNASSPGAKTRPKPLTLHARGGRGEGTHWALSLPAAALAPMHSRWKAVSEASLCLSFLIRRQEGLSAREGDGKVPTRFWR